MGLSYSYDLVFPREQVWNVMDSVLKLCEEINSEPNTRILLPDRVVELPFIAGNWAPGRPTFVTVDFTTSVRPLSFTIHPFFEVDNAIRRYLKTLDYEPRRNKSGDVSLQNIKLKVNPQGDNSYYYSCSENFCSFSFAPLTSQMSMLYEASPFIRKAFVDLLQKHQGLYGFFDNEEHFTRPIIWPPNLAGEPFYAWQQEIEALLSK